MNRGNFFILLIFFSLLLGGIFIFSNQAQAQTCPPTGDNWHEYQAGSAHIAYSGLVPCGKVLCINARVDSNGNLVITGGKPNCQGGCQETPCQFCHLLVMIDGVVDFGISTIVPLLFVLVIAIQAILLIFYFINRAAPDQAKTAVRSLIIGIIIILFCWLFVNAIFILIGLSSTGPLKDIFINPGSWSQVKCNVAPLPSFTPASTPTSTPIPTPTPTPASTCGASRGAWCSSTYPCCGPLSCGPTNFML